MQKSSKSVFIAGASGAVGVRLCKLLVSDGWTVTGTTRPPEKAKILESLGVRPVVVDVYDEARLTEAVVSAKPEIVIHQLTDLPDGLDPAQMAESRLRCPYSCCYVRSVWKKFLKPELRGIRCVK